jgi:hypothetical protein
MPFDATTFRQTSRVVHLPPQPPERGRGPRRIRIEIEITDRRAQPAPRPRFGVLQLLLVLFLLGLLFGRGHAQPTSWESHQLGSTRYYQGTDAEGGNWNGSSYRLGGTTYFDAEGPNGQRQHCESYRLGSTTSQTKRPRRCRGPGGYLCTSLNCSAA